MKDKLIRFIENKRNIIILFILFAIGASFQSLVSGMKTYHEGGMEYTRYNNYKIFERSSYHLKNNQDLYITYPEEHWDLYLYTPTFAAFFGVFAAFPDWIGLNLWNLLNALMLVIAIYYLPKLGHLQKGLILLIVLIELMTSMQNAQSNGLIAGLLVLSFGLLENKKLLLSSLCIVCTVFIKLFGIVGFALFLFYPKKWKLALYSIGWTLIFLLIPLIWIDSTQYTALFHSYIKMLTNDHSVSYGYSVMGWLHSWFSVGINKNIIVLTGVMLFLMPLAKYKAHKQFIFKYLTLASILIWIVIFNHKAESPTFIIAMTGVALWFVVSKKNVFNIALFVSAFVLTMLSPTDIFPRFLREELVKPYTLKAVPCIFIWLKIIYDMCMYKNEDTPGNTVICKETTNNAQKIN